MVNLNLSIVSLPLCAVIAACGARPLPPPVSPKVLEAKVEVWKRDATPLTLPAAVRRMQLIVTPGWAKDEHVAWLISNGSDVLRVFRCTSLERAELIDIATRATFSTSETPLDHISFSVLGSINKPPPPPPDPGGIPQGLVVSKLPKIYVQRVFDAAWNLNAEQVRIDATAAVAH
ncbi:MAG: hypothetical protein E6J90_07680 [Deltaproteobacteria bacterium]|nr:MAG: hypothetical protein E6J91_13245 [Deltaproteobacteria bacterium]TMQ24548.1 MAG: hypothetical protein E6J90_07680 [Deltaproteobacteria bacterium]